MLLLFSLHGTLGEAFHCPIEELNTSPRAHSNYRDLDVHNQYFCPAAYCSVYICHGCARYVCPWHYKPSCLFLPFLFVLLFIHTGSLRYRMLFTVCPVSIHFSRHTFLNICSMCLFLIANIHNLEVPFFHKTCIHPFLPFLFSMLTCYDQVWEQTDLFYCW